jgi:AmiR/NasT family two-component response regulator
MIPAVKGKPAGMRVIAADEDEQALRRTVGVLEGLGHEVTSLAVDVAGAAEQIARHDPELAVVVVHRDDEHALDLIGEMAASASGPVIALTDEDDPAFVARAAERGVHAYASSASPEAMQSAIEVAVRRHAETAELASQVDRLEAAMDRRAVIERAKGILMERHRVGEREAFELLRSQARSTNRPVAALAHAVVEGHPLLPPSAPS